MQSDFMDGLSRYVQMARPYEKLDEHETYALVTAWQENGDSEAMHKLIMHNLRGCVRRIARYRSSQFDVDDLFSECVAGIITAASKFDLNRRIGESQRRANFTTCAMWYIRAALTAYMTKNNSIVGRVGSSHAPELNALKDARRKCGIDASTYLTDENIEKLSHATRMSVQEIIRLDTLARSSAVVYLDSPIYDRVGDYKSTIANLILIDESPSPEEACATLDATTFVRDVVKDAIVACLNDRERSIVQARYFSENPQTLRELAPQYGISAERIRKIEISALSKLKSHLSSCAGGESAITEALA